MMICGTAEIVGDGVCVGRCVKDGTGFVVLGRGVLVTVCVGVKFGEGVCVGTVTVGTKVLIVGVGKGAVAGSLI